MNLLPRSLGLSAVVLLLTTHPLPAPISEVPETTPTPKPKREVISRPKPNPKAIAKPRVTPSRSFAGTWTGSAGDSSGTAVYVIKISDDEKMVWINWNQTGQPITGPGLQLPCNRFRETLTWTLTQETSTETDTLRIDANGSASFVRDGRVIAGDTFLDPGGPYNITGILSRQDFSPAPPATQTTTPTAAPPTTGLPTARPVPKSPDLFIIHSIPIHEPFSM